MVSVINRLWWMDGARARGYKAKKKKSKDMANDGIILASWVKIMLVDALIRNVMRTVPRNKENVATWMTRGGEEMVINGG